MVQVSSLFPEYEAILVGWVDGKHILVGSFVDDVAV